MKRFIVGTLAVGALIALAAPVGAQEIDVSKGAIGGIGSLTVPLIVTGIIRILVIAAAVLFFIWLLIGGLRWITSGGDKAKLEEARGQVTAAIVGLVIVFSAWAIAQLAGTLFGVDFFNQLKIESFQGQSAPAKTKIDAAYCLVRGKDLSADGKSCEN